MVVDSVSIAVVIAGGGGSGSDWLEVVGCGE